VLHVFTEGILVSQTFVNVRFNGVLKFAGTVNIRGFGTFSRRKSRES
jgi:nucleoid DNA-binding protein